MKVRGFSIVEIIIIITVMGILLTLAVVNLSGSQVNSRDDERKADIEAISTYLESFYRTGTDEGSGYYPPTDVITASLAADQGLRDVFADNNSKAFIAPGQSDIADSFVVAENDIQTTAGIEPSPAIGNYVYQPLLGDGTLCETGTACRKFNLYYRLESNDTIQMVTSKNQ